MSHENKICIVFSGIESLRGDRAVELVKRFNLKPYAGVKFGSGALFYEDFIPEIEKEISVESLRRLTGLFVWFGLNQIKFRFDRSYLADSQVDFQIHMIQEHDYITIPKIKYGH